MMNTIETIEGYGVFNRRISLSGNANSMGNMTIVATPKGVTSFIDFSVAVAVLESGTGNYVVSTTTMADMFAVGSIIEPNRILAA